jgi:putative drug exporter of the RND superfamily
MTDPASRAHPWSRPAWWVARLMVAARWPLLAAVLVVVGLALLRLPGVAGGSGAGIGDITSSENPALLTEVRSAQEFGFPLLSRTVLVQSDPSGLSDQATREAIDRATAVAKAPDEAPVAAAVPVPGGRTVPGVRRPGTTVVSYLFPKSGQDLGESMAGARAYAARFSPQAHVVGLTGTAAARQAQQHTIDSALPLVELASLVAVLLVVGLSFRSVAAPLLTLLVAGASFVLVTRVSGMLAGSYGWQIPADLQPLMVALLLGVTTDYVVYFLSGMQTELAAGRHRLEAARRTTATFAPIVLVAGVTVAAGVATLLLARTPAVRTFAPAMAIAVLVAMAVALLVLPPALAVLGRAAFWPRRSGTGSVDSLGGTVRRGTVRLLRNRFGGLAVALLCLAGLGALALPVTELRGGLPFVAALPDDTEVARAARAATEGFVPGITSPTLVDVAVPAGATQQSVERLQDLLQKQTHVAAVLGPREDETVSAAAGRRVGVFVSADRTAVRYLVLLDVDPLDAQGIGAVGDLGRALPGLLQQAGFPAATASLGGDTAAVASLVDQTSHDLLLVVVAALVVNLLMLAAFLRALVAPLFLLVCTVLSATATLGLTVLVFQHRLGHPGVTFFVPLATGVLLLALGSDYNLFAVGHVWEEARRHPLREAMLAAIPRSSRAITTAGVALAASLGALALVPLRQFRELAFALVVGILIDALVVRTVLAPALLGVFGRLSGWPGRRLVADPAP